MGKMAPIDVIRMALEREEHAVRLYEEFASTARDESVKKMFHFLAGEERKHVRLLQDEIEKEVYQEM